MRSALAFEGGHQISVNLFLNAGDNCSKTAAHKFENCYGIFVTACWHPLEDLPVDIIDTASFSLCKGLCKDCE